LLGSCVSQERGGLDLGAAVPLLKQILAKANVSGSLAYWGRCDFHKPYPDFPALSYPSNSSGSPLELLQKAFASDPEMEVTQESNGVVRMFETDVPTDLLDVTISHVSFMLGDQRRDTFGGPNNAMFLVLSAPEVIAYRRAQYWASHGFVDSSWRQRLQTKSCGRFVQRDCETGFRLHPAVLSGILDLRELPKR
jgi:hypothetical protein